MIDNLLGGGGEERSSAFGIVRRAVGGVKDAKVVVNFRGGGESGAARASRMALFDGQGRSPADMEAGTSNGYIGKCNP